MKVRLKILLIILLLSIIFVVYISLNKINLFNGKSDNVGLNIASYPSIDFGYELWPGYLFVTLANKLGYFKNEGIIVKEIAYSENEKLTKDFSRGFLEAKADYASAVVDSASKGDRPSKIILSTDYSLGGDGIVAREGVKSFIESNNPKVGYAGNLDFFLLYIIKKLGKTKDNITLLHQKSDEEAVSALNDKKIDYLFTYDPYLSEAIDGGANLEYSSNDVPGILVDSIIFDSEYINKNPKAIDAFVRAYFKAYKYWQKNKIKAYEIVGPTYQLSKEDFEKQMDKIRMISIEENINSMEMSAGSNSIYGNLRMISMFMNEIDSSYSNVDHFDLVYPNSIEKIYNEM